MHNYTEYNQQWNLVICIWLIRMHTHLEQWTHTHTLGAVDTVHSGNAPARPPHVTLYKIHLFETH